MPMDKNTVRDRVIFLAVSTVILIIIGTAVCTPLRGAVDQTMESVTLFVATDLHYLATELADNVTYIQ